VNEESKPLCIDFSKCKENKAQYEQRDKEYCPPHLSIDPMVAQKLINRPYIYQCIT